jgi:hypothetical protein
LLVVYNPFVKPSCPFVCGDYKRRADPTCAPFEPINCDLFITGVSNKGHSAKILKGGAAS